MIGANHLSRAAALPVGSFLPVPHRRHLLSLTMADIDETLDFFNLALLDEEADDPVSRGLVYNMSPVTASCVFGDGDGDTLDMLSICDSTSSAGDSMASPGLAFALAADERHNNKHVQLSMEEISAETKRCDKLLMSSPAAATPQSTEQMINPLMSLQLKRSANPQFIGAGTFTHWHLFSSVSLLPWSHLCVCDLYPNE